MPEERHFAESQHLVTFLIFMMTIDQFLTLHHFFTFILHRNYTFFRQYRLLSKTSMTRNRYFVKSLVFDEISVHQQLIGLLINLHP